MKTLTTIILVLGLTMSTYSQVAPTEGRKTMKVTNKFHGEYNKKVVSSFAKAPRDYHMKKLPKKLAKYGFTNVKITALGSVSYNSKNPISRLDVGIAQIRVGANVETVINTVTTKVDTSKFQVNFTSDQGTFKVRLSMLVSPRYIIKENVNEVAIN
jgi:hypothetical protein